MPAINKQEIIEKYSFKGNSADTGSCESQIAIFTYRIQHLTQHLSSAPKDHATRKQLVHLANKRKKILAYLKRKDLNRYTTIAKKLNIRIK